MSPKVRFNYFNVRGLGEVTRVMLAYGNVNYEDHRLTFEEWAAYKPNTQFGQLPVLEWDGVKASQSNAIARFVAKKVGLYGKDDNEAVLIDSVVELVRDLTNGVAGINEAKDKNAFFAKYVAETVSKFLDNAEKFLKEHGGTYFVGNHLTWADIAVAEHIGDITNPNEPRVTAMGLQESTRLTILDKYPLVKAHLARVKAVPAIKKWHETRPSDAADAEVFKGIFAFRAAQAAAEAKK